MESAVRAYNQVCRMDLRDQLILEHLPYVRHILGRMISGLPDHVDDDNLESAGILGLVEAAGQYDPTRGVAFTTFAYRRIRGAILDELRRNCPLPQNMLQTWAVLREHSLNMTPPLTAEKLAAASGLPINEVEDCLAAMRLTRPESWASELSTIPCHRTEESEAEAATERTEEIRLLADAIEALPEKMRLAITLYHREGLRMKEVGEVLGLSESRVSRLLASAELRLRTLVRRATVDEEQV
ncbi:MAG: sigma-70 family RNA polymerase sigma factor [Planctomycetaceae bacterium]|nr:sigma-70 family RNA polymerase sigma factor [Planctomycetaceae bacterium]